MHKNTSMKKNTTHLQTTNGSAPEETWLGITFYSHQMLYVTKINFIEAVIPVGKIYSLPCPDPNILGISHYHNRVFIVIDLKAILWQKKSALSSASRIIIYRYFDLWIGCLVCSCQGLKTFNLKDNILSSPESPQTQFVKKMINIQETNWALLDIHKIITALNNRELLLSPFAKKEKGSR